MYPTELLKPLFISAKFFGLAPITIRNNSVTPPNVASKTKAIVTFKNSFFSLMVFMILTSIFIYVFTCEPISSLYDANTNFIEETVDSLEAYMSALTASICILYNYRNRYKIAKIVNYTQFFDASFLRQGMPASEMYLDSGKHKFTVFLIIGVMYLWFFASAILERINYTDETMMQWIVYIIPPMVTTLLISQFVIISFALKTRFWLLNKLIRQNGGGAGGARTGNGCGTSHSDGSDVPKMVDYEYVKEVHLFLCSIATLIKETYSKQVLFVMMQSTITIVSSALFLANSILHSDGVGDGEEGPTDLLYFYSILMFCYCLFQMASVTWISIYLPLEAKRTVQILFNDCVNIHQGQENNSPLMFGFQVLNDDINFELCRGFPVDGSLLSNVSSIGTITKHFH